MKKHKPYYAVIFTSKQSENTEGYDEMADQMEALAKKQAGFIGIESARNTVGITVSYWESLEAIKNWKQQTNHLIAQKKGVRIGTIGIKLEFVKWNVSMSFLKFNLSFQGEMGFKFSLF